MIQDEVVDVYEVFYWWIFCFKIDYTLFIIEKTSFIC